MLDAGIDVLLDASTSSTSSRSTTRSPSSRACACARRCPTRCSARPTRSSSSTSRPRRCSTRLRAGKVYPPGARRRRAQRLLPIENLAALREIALRQVAEEVEAKRLVSEPVGTRRTRSRDAAPQAVGERLLALVEPYRVASGWSGARGARPSGSAPSSTSSGCARREPRRRRRRAQLGALRQLASVLGAHCSSSESDDVADAIARGRPRAGHDLRPDRRAPPAPAGWPGCAPAAPAPAWSRSPASTSASSPTAPLRQARHRTASHDVVADRDRRPSPCGRPVTGSPRTAGSRRTGRGRCAASCCPSPAPRSRAARWMRRSAWPGPRTRWSCPHSWRACREPAARRAAARAVRGRHAAAGGDRAARRSQGVAVDSRISRGAPTVTLCAPARPEHVRPRDRLGERRRPHGLDSDDLEWLLEPRPGRGPDPAPGSRRPAPVTAEAVAGTSKAAHGVSYVM